MKRLEPDPLPRRMLLLLKPVLKKWFPNTLNIVVFLAVVVPTFWFFISTYSQAHRSAPSSRRYQVVTSRVRGLLDEGDAAWQEGDLKTAKACFRAVIYDKADLPSKDFFVQRASAKLAKIDKQEKQGKTRL